MAEPHLTFWDYVKRAFFVKPHIKGLGEMPVNILAVGAVAVFGLGFPPIWLFGAAAEVAYLGLVSSDPRFQKWVRAMESAAQSGDQSARKEALLSGLADKRQMRYRELEGRCGQMLESSQKTGVGLERPLYDSVNRLLWVFLRLLVSSEMLETHIRQTSREVLQKEIATYERQLAEASADPSKERIARSLAGTLEIANKRLQNLEKAHEDAQFIQAELLRIEQQVNLMIQEAALSRDPASLTGRVDEVMQSFTQTQDWMKANAEILGAADDTEIEPPPTFQVPG